MAIDNVDRPEADDAHAAQRPAPVTPLARPVAYGSYESNPQPHPFLLSTLSRKSAWADLGLLLLTVVAFELVSNILIDAWLSYTGTPVPDDGPTPEIIQKAMIPGLILRAAGTFLIVAILMRSRGLSLSSVGIRRSGWLLDLVIGVGGLVFCYAAIYTTFFIIYFFIWPGILDEFEENRERLSDIMPALTGTGFLMFSLLIGMYEELLFRGFMMPRLRRATGSWTVAVLLNSAVFTALHAFDQTMGALIMIGVLSISFSLIVVWRRSIVPALVAHALFDFSQFLFIHQLEV